MAKTIHTASMMDILPPNLKKDANVAAIAKALDEELHLTATDTKEVIHIARIDELPERVLDLLAWQFHVDSYEPIGLSVETKRKLIKESIAWHRIKGTPAAIEAVVSAYFDNAKVQEWFDYGGEPYHFRVGDITGPVAGADTINTCVTVINHAKNVRSWLDEIGFRSDIPPGKKDAEGEYINESFLLAFATGQFGTIEIYPGISITLAVAGIEHIGAAYLVGLPQNITNGTFSTDDLPHIQTYRGAAVNTWNDITIYPEEAV